ncbi:UNVERIFIED_ORG: host transcription shutoff [Salmonella phage PSP2-22]
MYWEGPITLCSGSTDFKALEERVALKWRNADRMAIADGRALNIDKQLDAMLMG